MIIYIDIEKIKKKDFKKLFVKKSYDDLKSENLDFLKRVEKFKKIKPFLRFLRGFFFKSGKTFFPKYLIQQKKPCSKIFSRKKDMMI